VACDLLAHESMRSILVLFAIASLGFIVILQKKDAPEGTGTKAKAVESKLIGQHNWMKHSPDKIRVVAQNVVQSRKEIEAP
jgi:hypothetical protein